VSACVPWALFLFGGYALLRPALLTTVAADDLINPFSQMYHAGTTIGPIWRRVVDSVSITGHFNYIGQFFGSIVVLIWSYLIGALGLRFSFVYALTKYVFFVLAILVIASYARSALHDAGREVSKWICRAIALAALALPLQIHIPWSNDPTASYPMAGYGTALLGVLYLLLCHKALQAGRLRGLAFVGLLGALAVLYYEFNSFAILASLVFFLNRAWTARHQVRMVVHEFGRYAICVGPAAVTTLYFYFRNRSASANYSGTALRLSDPFIEKFRNGIISSAPGSSWPLAHDWLGHTTRLTARSLQFFFVGLVAVGLLIRVARERPQIEAPTQSLKWRRLLIAASAPVVYWLGATFTQTATQKVQDESQRIGQVYNYYAVGSVAVALILTLILLGLTNGQTQRSIRAGVAVLCIVVGGYQYATNWNVLLRFNEAMKPSADLLAAFADKPDMATRCAQLDRWKTMGWPEYYWLDLELGMNMMYQLNHQEEFCRR